MRFPADPAQCVEAARVLGMQSVEQRQREYRVGLPPRIIVLPPKGGGR